MNYWMTTHWPPRTDEEKSNIGLGVWISERCRSVGNDLRPGDKVIIYQSRSGRPEIFEKADGTSETIGCHTGKEGIIALGEATTDVYLLKDVKPSKYTDGTEVWWRWHADLKLISQSGFVPRLEINKILGYKSNYNFRGFGDNHSGLKRIKESEFTSLVEIFRRSIEIKQNLGSTNPSSHTGGFGGEESDAHKSLKQYVADNPESVFSEKGISTLQVEYPFPTMDRADILLTDSYGRIIGVEIEVNVNDGQFEGLLQAIKYRYMGELMTSRKPGDSRAVLIAYSISQNMKKLCSDYNITFIEVEKSTVDNWLQKQSI